MSYLSHLADRALGLTQGSIRPRLAPYFAPEPEAALRDTGTRRDAPGQETRVRELVETRPPESGGASPQATRAGQATPQAALPAGAPPATQAAVTGAPEPGEARPEPGPAIISPVDAKASVQEPAREVREVAGQAVRVAARRAAEPGAMPHQTSPLGTRAGSRPVEEQTPASLPPDVHIRIGRVEVRAVFAPEAAANPPGRVAGMRATERAGGLSLEEYLARPHGGGS